MTGKIDLAIQALGGTAAVALGVAGIAGTALVAIQAKTGERRFIDSLIGKSLVFPSDLDKYSVSMAFDFKQYQRRSIFTQPYMKPLGTIRLPIPKNLKDDYKITWEEKSQDPIVGAAMETLLSTNAINKVTSGDPAGALVDLGNSLTGLMSGAAVSLGQSGLQNARDAISRVTGGGANINLGLNEILQPLGLAVNPFLTVLFKQPNFKRFSFSWKLAARTPEESATINSIIQSFKYHMLPDIPNGRSNGGTMIGYPDMVQIGFYSSDQYLFRFKPCVIEDFAINYAPASTPSFFKGENNVPTEVEINLNLLEIEYWTKQDFDNSPMPFDTGGYIPGTTGVFK
jgi:hypothetical protein